MPVFTVAVIIKLVIAVIIYFFHHLQGRYLKGVVLALAAWILIPGLDELIIMPLLASIGILNGFVIFVYYAIGVLLLLLGVFIL